MIRASRIRPKLAYVSPLPPVRSGIAAYSLELLPELAKHYSIELIADQETVAHSLRVMNFPIRDTAWLSNNPNRADRVLYHFGNSPFHKHMYDLIKHVPGVVVLHDFYIGHLLHWMHYTGWKSNVFFEELYYSHGEPALKRAAEEGEQAALWAYPMNKTVLDNATGIIAHSAYAVQAARHWYGPDASAIWHIIPHLRALPNRDDRSAARQKLAIPEDDFLICSFGRMQQSKNSERLLDAFIASRFATGSRARLAFVGETPGDEYEDSIRRKIADSKVKEQIRITGYVSDAIYRTFLDAADIGVQLRTLTRGETSGSVLDVLAHGVPLIVNAHGPMTELPRGCVTMLPEEFDDAELVAALEELWRDLRTRESMGKAAREWITRNHHPRRIGELYRNVIEASSGRRTSHGSECIGSSSTPLIGT